MPYLEQIWQTRWLTNSGPLHQELEQALCEYLGVPHLSLFANGTIALVAALRSLGITQEVITTPYSFVATAHSILWSDCQPVFVDIDPETMNLDPERVEAAITPRTTAIMPVHVYGTPCDVERLQQIAANHRLKVIYDAAHAFGVRYKGDSLLIHGDLSVLSFHATKVFTTLEGGAIVSPNAETKQHIDSLRNFGIADEVTVTHVGINGKMNEIQAAFGLMQLKHIDIAIRRRETLDQRYRQALVDVPGITVPSESLHVDENYSYFPVLIGPDYSCGRDALYSRLQEERIHARRYFYPLISNMPMYRQFPSAAEANLPIAQRVAGQVLCLPIYPNLEERDQERVIQTLKDPR